MSAARPVTLALATGLMAAVAVTACGSSGGTPAAKTVQRVLPSPAPASSTSSAPAPASTPSAALRPRTQLSVVITGDSIPQDLGPMVVASLNGPGLAVRSEAHPISGLVRNDYFDWSAQARKVLAEHPTTVIMLIGGNDVQAFQLADKSLLQPATPAWQAEYARRVGAVMDIWRKGGVKQIYWLTMPTTTRSGMNAGIASMGRAVHTAATGRSGVTVYDSDVLLGANAGSPAVHGPDGIHLSILGSQMISNALIGRLRVDAGLVAG